MAWTFGYFIALSLEKRVRFPDNPDHKSFVELHELFSKLLPLAAAGKSPIRTPFANCASRTDMGLDFRDEPCVYTAYRKFMVERWKRDVRKPKWTNRPEPAFRGRIEAGLSAFGPLSDFG